jgi:hypothetical protein
MAHTPGPWDIVFTGTSSRIRLNGSTVYQVRDVTDPEFPSGAPRYNLDDLRLMAAAPELLSALKLCREAMLNLYHNSNEIPEESPEFDEGGACHNALGAALRVLNKAEGRGE